MRLWLGGYRLSLTPPEIAFQISILLIWRQCVSARFKTISR